MNYPPVTVALLIYRSPAWLNFCLEGLVYARNKTPMRVLVVGNDANEEVMATGRVDVDHRNSSGKRMARVYAAWNKAVESAETEWVCLLNSDMFVSHGWLDALMDQRMADGESLPCSLLVENGHIPSAMPEYVRDFGRQPHEFDVEGFMDHAERIRLQGTEPGRLYMPVLFNRDEFLRLGGYPLGNPPGTTGDKDLFARYAVAGYKHVTCLNSVVAHLQCGEAGEWYGDD